VAAYTANSSKVHQLSGHYTCHHCHSNMVGQ